MAREYHSSYTWLFPRSSTAVEPAENSIFDWCTAFDTPFRLMSDGRLISGMMHCVSFQKDFILLNISLNLIFRRV